MRSFTRIAISALAVLHAINVNAESAAACAEICGNTVLNAPKPLGCANAQDFPCLCKKTDFYYGIQTCLEDRDACTPDRQSILDFLNNPNRCDPFGNATVPEEATASKAEPSSTMAPTTSTSVAAATTSQASTSDLPTTTSSTISEASAEATSSTTSVESTTTTDPATESTSAAAAAGSGLSYAATVGIGVGVAAVVVAAAIIGFCILKNRKRNPKPRQSLEISKPLPGSGRTYPTRERQTERDSFEKYEMTANRYEDMVPRTQPRTMV